VGEPFSGPGIDPSRTVELRTLFSVHGKRLWCYFVPFLCCYSLAPRRIVRVTEWGGATWVTAHSDGPRGRRVDLVVPPLPFVQETWDVGNSAITEINEGASPRILWSDAEDAAIGGKMGLRVQEKETEYIYDPRAIAALEGRPFRDLRKRVRRFEREVGARIRPLEPPDVDDCDLLLKHWRRLQGRRHPFLLDWGYTRASLDRFSQWSVEEMRGWVLDQEGRTLGFAMAGPLGQDEACFFVAKSDPETRWASESLRWQVYEELRGYRCVNDAGDLGLPGLCQYKRKFRPVERLQSFGLESS